jgi:acetylornithine/N-succinyldiaminopimelate aminotransferase
MTESSGVLEDIARRESNAVIQTYTRQPVFLVRGSGATVWDAEGKEYLDMVAGIAVNNVGHCHPDVVAAIRSQAARLIHTSNIYYTKEQILLAERLKSLTGMDRAFFCNSGAESIEAALKLARRATKKSSLVAAERSFHGRTLGALGATYKAAYREPFRPLNEAKFVPFNDQEALKSAVTKDVGAVILEPVQGEAGVYVPDPEYLRLARQLCDDHGAVLIFDEVQTGFGRTGEWFGKNHSGVQPDIMTLAKAVAGGLPMGVMLASKNVSEVFQRGDHASTFGGGPLVCAAALASLDVLEKEQLVQRSRDNGEYLMKSLQSLSPLQVRGLGLMVGVDFSRPSAEILTAARDNGVLLNSTGPNTLRLVPPLVISIEEIDRLVSILAEIVG